MRFYSASADGQAQASGLTFQIGKKLVFIRRTAGGGYVYKLPGREALARVREYARALKGLAAVREAEPDVLMQRVFNEPDDTFYRHYQWHYQGAPGGINALGAWRAFARPPVEPVRVAVIDTGVRSHVDLQANLSAGVDLIGDARIANDGDGRDMDASDPGDWVEQGECYQGSSPHDSSWHGTHVAGILVAATNNGEGVAGLTYNMAKAVPVRVLGKCGGYLSDTADGIRWAAGEAVNGVASIEAPVQVINLSLGGSGACGTELQRAIDSAVATGITVVVASGNSSADASHYQPASCDGVVTVAATDAQGERTGYSSYGAVVELAAPGGGGGGGIASTLNSGARGPGKDNYAVYQGSSMATPHVAATVALMYLKDASLAPEQVTTLLMETARPFPGPCDGCGRGILDAGAAVAAAAGGGNHHLATDPGSVLSGPNR
ncbi:S8 family peptidase [Motiliproteus sp. SC1-56]|uniref:S8 family peptidase n=1 Tax=Motiliproteus sp. SC1-56 TaxID=2799565 RepID=UPI001A8EA6FF